jgi:hypothetical protein
MKEIVLREIKKSLLYVIRVSSKYYKKLNGTGILDNPQGLEDFTPKILSEEDDKYSESLKYAIDNSNTKNVALTGTYGSGKSSILKTFENKYPEYECLNISLATFNENKQDSKEIEFCILKQLFYKVEQSKIPESRFKRIENHRFIRFKTFLFILWLLSFVHYFKSDILDNAINLFHLNFYSAWASVIYFVYFVLGICFLVYKIMGFVLNFKLTKFSFQNTEIENGDTKKSKDFENEIDEILYFFERNTINVVFIEDLDRFKNTNIFIKLREINFLINNYDPIKEVRKVTFVYAVQDDTFKKEERTKFFDFIIPVIPIINYSNSSTELLNKIDIKEDKIEKSFIDEVSLYLSDKRILISIVNEYKIYKKIIGKDLNKRKLLAMMIYKNIEPTDFEYLNKEKGYVYNAFSNSNELIEDVIREFDKKIQNLEVEVKEINAHTLNDVKELRNLYIFEFYKKVSPAHQIYNFYINNSACSLEQLTSDVNFEEFSKSTNIQYYYDRNYLTNNGISFKQLEESIGSYQIRAKQIKDKNAKYLNERKIKIEYFKTEKQAVKAKNFCQLLLEYDSSNYLSKIVEEYPVQNQNLVNYLLRFGHIDESYTHYISHFYEGSISKSDNDFLLCFTNGTTLPFTHKLEELDILFLKLKGIPDYFDRLQILNYSLLDYLVENSPKNATEELRRVLALIIINASHEFIDGYINYATAKNSSNFIIELNNLWNTYSEPGFWSEIADIYPVEKLKFYLNLMFSCATTTKVKEFINRFDVEQQINDFLSVLEDVTYFENNKTKLMEFISDANIKFKHLNGISNKEILNFIYNYNQYEINEKMIALFLNKYVSNPVDLEELQTANYTTIKKSGASKLIKYIDLNIELYIKAVFLRLENNCNESEEVIIELLNENCDDFGLELSGQIIDKNQTVIQDISKINNLDLYAKLLQDDKVAVKWDNLLFYYQESEEIDAALIDYLNKESHYSILYKTVINKDFHEKDSPLVKDFLIKLINSDISIKSFEKIVEALPYKYLSIDSFIAISKDKMRLLIENQKVRFNSNVYKSINDKFPDLLIFLLEKNNIGFMENVGNYTLDAAIIRQIIDSAIFDSEQKMIIMDNTPDSTLMENQVIVKKVCHLLSNNRKTAVSLELLKELLTQSQSIEDKVKLFNLYYLNYDRSELVNIIELLGEPYSRITKGKRPPFDNNSYNLDFVTKMKDIFISNFEISDDNKTIQTWSKKASMI